jgi:hypothetical protein
VYVSELRLDQLIEKLMEAPRPGRHKDYWLTKIQDVCADGFEEHELENWCEENLLFWNDPEFKA